MIQAVAAPVVRRYAETPERWHKALERALAGGVEVFRVAGTGEMVATSATRLDVVYRVSGRECECAAALAGDPICVHRAAARFILGWLALPEAEAGPACPACNGCGAVDYGRYALPCDACNGCGVAPDRRLHDAPAVEIAA